MTENFDINKHGRVLFEVNEVPQPTDLELRIRREVMDAINELIEQSGPNTHLERRVGELGAILQNRLNLLWGDNENL